MDTNSRRLVNLTLIAALASLASACGNPSTLAVSGPEQPLSHPPSVVVGAPTATPTATPEETSTPEVVPTPGANPTPQPPPLLDTWDSFAILAGNSATNSGATVVVGSVGSVSGAVSGFDAPAQVTNGLVFQANEGSIGGQAAYSSVLDALTLNYPCDVDLSGQDLAGLTLTQGVYCLSEAQLTGALHLWGEGNPDATFIFIVVGTMTTAADSSVSLDDGASARNVYWAVGDTVTIGARTVLPGMVLGVADVVAANGAQLTGHLYSQYGSVTTDTANIQCPVAP